MQFIAHSFMNAFKISLQSFVIFMEYLDIYLLTKVLIYLFFIIARDCSNVTRLPKIFHFQVHQKLSQIVKVQVVFTIMTKFGNDIIIPYAAHIKVKLQQSTQIN